MESHRGPSIEQYSAFILSDKRVIHILGQIEQSNRMAEHFLRLSLENVDAEERHFATRFFKAIDYAKEQSIRDIIATSIPNQWLYTHNLEDVARNTVIGQASYEDLPLVLLQRLAQDPQFMSYLLRGELPWFSSLPADRTQQFVFALYLWLKMDARYDAATGRAYYVETSEENVTQRTIFIELFKSYIHTDLWQAEDYEKHGKHGVIIRLRFSVPQSGQVVIQECGEKTPRCNRLYLVTKESIRVIEEEYLKSGKLGRPTLHFQCHYCGNQNACLFISMKEKIHFYCDKMCFDANKS